MQKNIKNNIKSRGFTIVELLVVIVVIGILAAITVVSYSGVTAKARTASNQSNANNVLQAAMNVYAENGTYPATSATSSTVITNLNAGVTKVPSTITVTSTVISAATESLTYLVNSGGTGVCVGYWSYSGTVGVTWMTGGAATVSGSTCS